MNIDRPTEIGQQAQAQVNNGDNEQCEEPVAISQRVKTIEPHG